MIVRYRWFYRVSGAQASFIGAIREGETQIERKLTFREAWRLRRFHDDLSGL